MAYILQKRKYEKINQCSKNIKEFETGLSYFSKIFVFCHNVGLFSFPFLCTYVNSNSVFPSA